MTVAAKDVQANLVHVGTLVLVNHGRNQLFYVAMNINQTGATGLNQTHSGLKLQLLS